MKKSIKHNIQLNCTYFSSTSDMWSSQTMKAFMALTIHFLTEEFMMRSYTLEAKPVQGKHTGEMIMGDIKTSFLNWGLDKDRLSMMLRDSGLNMVKACKDWKIKHFPCIGHSLHLVVGPFLLVPKTKKSTAVNNTDDDGMEEFEAEADANLDADIEEEEDVFSDAFDNVYANQEIILEICEVVQDMRKFCTFVKNSTKCIKKLEDLQNRLNTDSDAKVLKVQMDVRTQWSLTLAMIKRMLLLMQPINDFIAFYKSPAGKKEFEGNKMKVPDITPK